MTADAPSKGRTNAFDMPKPPPLPTTKPATKTPAPAAQSAAKPSRPKTTSAQKPEPQQPAAVPKRDREPIKVRLTAVEKATLARIRDQNGLSGMGQSAIWVIGNHYEQLVAKPEVALEVEASNPFALEPIRQNLPRDGVARLMVTLYFSGEHMKAFKDLAAKTNRSASAVVSDAIAIELAKTLP